MIKMITFDLFGVLIEEAHMISGTLMPLLPEKTSKQWVKSFYNPYTRGEISEVSFWQGIDQGNNPTLRQKFLHDFTLDTDATAVMQTLSEQHQLSILSNLGSEWADVLIHRFQFQQTCSPIIISGKVGCAKPNPKIYNLLLEQCPYAAHEILFVDDRLENLAAAHALGIQTVHYQREHDGFNYQADHQIHKLREVLDILLMTKGGTD